jgi:hypothetical protein
MSGFRIEELPEDKVAGLPPRFRVLPEANPSKPHAPAQLDLCDLINAQVERVTAGEARAHPKRALWIERLRDLAKEGLERPDPATAAADEKAKRLSKAIHFNLERFAEAPFVVRHEPGSTEISVGRKHGTAPPSADQEAFLDEFQQADSFLQSLYRPSLGVLPPPREEAAVWSRLASAGELALGDARPSLAVARGALRAIMRDAIRDRAPAYRQAYLRRLWQSYLVALLCTAALLLAFHWLTHQERYLGPSCAHWIGGRCWELPAAMRVTGERLIFFTTSLASLAFGAWLSACARLDTNSPEVLTAMLSETNPTPARAVMVLGFGAVALILLHTGLVVVEIGDARNTVFDSKAALRQLPTCVLIGIFLGLGERALPGVINQRATAFVAGLGGAGAPAPR